MHQKIICTGIPGKVVDHFHWCHGRNISVKNPVQQPASRCRKVFLTDRVARVSSSAAAQSANAEASQGAQAGVPICLCLILAC